MIHVTWSKKERKRYMHIYSFIYTISVIPLIIILIMKSKFHWTTFVIIFALCESLCVWVYTVHARYLRSLDLPYYTHVLRAKAIWIFHSCWAIMRHFIRPPLLPLLCRLSHWMCGAHTHPTENYQMTKRNENASNNRFQWCDIFYILLCWIRVLEYFEYVCLNATRAAELGRWMKMKAMTSFAIELLLLDIIRRQLSHVSIRASFEQIPNANITLASEFSLIFNLDYFGKRYHWNNMNHRNGIATLNCEQHKGELVLWNASEAQHVTELLFRFRIAFFFGGWFSLVNGKTSTIEIIFTVFVTLVKERRWDREKCDEDFLSQRKKKETMKSTLSPRRMRGIQLYDKHKTDAIGSALLRVRPLLFLNTRLIHVKNERKVSTKKKLNVLVWGALKSQRPLSNQRHFEKDDYWKCLKMSLLNAAKAFMLSTS